MAKRSAIPSLLPYLWGNPAAVGLRISLDPGIRDPRNGEAVFPFLPVDQSDPMAQVLEGEFLSDAQSQVRPVFLSIQRDEYTFSDNVLWPRTNVDIDRCWQRAFSVYGNDSGTASLIQFSGQIDTGGELMPYRSLFFCRFKKVYFHPPCPVCGADLELCTDEALLETKGLASYSGSLKRFLFCPTCMELAGETNFYVKARDSGDSPDVRDCRQLIGEFASLSQDRAKDLPCTGCDHHGECYGPEGLAASRVMPVSFYPFYMLIFKAMSVKAVDFLGLLSGAAYEELKTRVLRGSEKGRALRLERLRKNGEEQPPFLASGHSGRFLETLYLKLSFLGELYADLSDKLDELAWPDRCPSLDGVWVGFGDESGRLPFLWNFSVATIGINGRGDQTEGMPKAPPAFGLYMMGLCWFYALTVNREHGMDAVYRTLAPALAELADGVAPGSNTEGATFSPAHIFWSNGESVETALDDASMALWRRSLDLGWRFLAAAYQASPWSERRFWDDWNALTREVKESLFGPKAAEADNAAAVADRLTAPPRDGSEGALAGAETGEEALFETLRDIAAKWRDEMDGSGVSASTKTSQWQPEDRQGLEETVVLSTGTLPETEAPAEAEPEPEADADAVQETVILSAGSFGEMPKRTKASASGSPSRGDEELAETVVLGGRKSQSPVGERPAEGDDEALLTETVVMSPAVGRANDVSGNSTGGAETLGGKTDEKGEAGEGRKGRQEETNSEESLTETVIIKPN